MHSVDSAFETPLSNDCCGFSRPTYSGRPPPGSFRVCHGGLSLAAIQRAWRKVRLGNAASALAHRNAFLASHSLVLRESHALAGKVLLLCRSYFGGTLLCTWRRVPLSRSCVLCRDCGSAVVVDLAKGTTGARATTGPWSQSRHDYRRASADIASSSCAGLECFEPRRLPARAIYVLASSRTHAAARHLVSFVEELQSVLALPRSLADHCICDFDVLARGTMERRLHGFHHSPPARAA